jgi:hypothetical protein
VNKTGIIAALVGLAAVVVVLVVVPGMRDAGFIIRAYVVTAVIIAAYIWFLARRLDQVEKGRGARQEDVAP